MTCVGYDSIHKEGVSYCSSNRARADKAGDPLGPPTHTVSAPCWFQAHYTTAGCWHPDAATSIITYRKQTLNPDAATSIITYKKPTLNTDDATSIITYRKQTLNPDAATSIITYMRHNVHSCQLPFHQDLIP